LAYIYCSKSSRETPRACAIIAIASTNNFLISLEIGTIRFLPGDFAIVDLIEKVTGLRFPGVKTGDVELHVAALLGLSQGKWVWYDGRPHPYLPQPDNSS
jgi:hypothetical protein